jgi:hypothetical protein
MSESGGLVDWVDQLAQLLEGQLGGDGQAWVAASYEADLPRVDFEAHLRAARTEQERLILVTARRVAIRIYIGRIGGPDLLLCPEDSPAWQLVLTMAVRAAEAAHRRLCDQFGPQIPPGLREIKKARRVRQAADALRGGAPTITSAAAAAGMPRGSFYRVLNRKTKG